MNFGIITLNQNVKTMQYHFIWILTVLSMILKLKIFIKIFQLMLKKDNIHQMMKLIDYYQKK